ncbi:MAG: hypothetical protein LUF78_04585 [Clostridiales bacterium]|nr:hypothetical protein [Clostridiales bacterium]MCD8153955.1 hypothetical protein [Clostridiales bacterium]
METILSKISEIEATAEQIVAETGRRKAALSEEYEQEQKAFDRRLEQETEEQIRQIQQKLEKAKDEKLSALREETQQRCARLDSCFEKNQEKLTDQLFHQILGDSQCI